MRRPLIQLSSLIVALVLSGCATVKHRPSTEKNDIRDVKAAFATLIEYQKTDDIRSLDLFSPTCVVIFDDGSTGKTAVWPHGAFLDSLRKQIALKDGDMDTYEDVRYSDAGTNVLVDATIHYSGSGKRGPFSAVYGRDSRGVYKIQELRVMVFPSASL